MEIGAAPPAGLGKEAESPGDQTGGFLLPERFPGDGRGGEEAEGERWRRRTARSSAQRIGVAYHEAGNPGRSPHVSAFERGAPWEGDEAAEKNKRWPGGAAMAAAAAAATAAAVASKIRRPGRAHGSPTAAGTGATPRWKPVPRVDPVAPNMMPAPAFPFLKIFPLN